MRIFLTYWFILSLSTTLNAQISKVWVADQGDGTYKNPVLHADYSDPDVIRVGEDFYMTASSFNASPSLPILHSKDLVNWTIINHALPRQIPSEHFSKPQHGNGVWAPAIRFHNNEFYIYYPDPDFGIYMIKTKNIRGVWEKPVLVKAGKGLIDPCPFWDKDGKVYLIHAYAGSRAGIKSILTINQLNEAGTEILDDAVLVFDGHDKHPTLEGPKLYKHNNYYYISAPAGGVSTGWQLVLRSKNVYGPYEEKIVLAQGNSSVNGPHQGAWVDTPVGEWWFLHFQDKGAYGRVVHLQPMKWVNDFPVIGIDKDGDGCGEPVITYQKPKTSKNCPVVTPPDSDEFSDNRLGFQWQWHANPGLTWAFPTGITGNLRMFSVLLPENHKNLWDIPNLLLQKFPAETFQVTTKLRFSPHLPNETFGLVMMGIDYAYLGIQKRNEGLQVFQAACYNADKGETETVSESKQIVLSSDIWLRVIVKKGGVGQFSFSMDGQQYTLLGKEFVAKEGKWIGTKIGMFFSRNQVTNDAGYADIDYFRVEPVNQTP